MFVFGGGDGKRWLNDLIVFNITQSEWSGPIETRGNSPPSGRLQHAAVVFDKKLFIFGGEPDRFRQLNDLFCLDTTTMTWSEPIVDGIPPSPRVSVTGCLVNNTVYFFGGFDGQKWLNDLHTLNLESMVWKNQKTYGQIPLARCRHTANYLKGKLYIFGGNDCDMSFNNVHNLWIKIEVPSATLSNDLGNLL